jgi:hypothetical protein
VQGGALITFDNDYGIGTLNLHGPLVCQTGLYNPAIFTSIDDDSQREPPLLWFAEYEDISSSSPVTASNGFAYLNLDGADTNYISLSYLRFCYADQAATTPTNSGTMDIWNCQFLQCNTGLNSWAQTNATTNRLHNVLFGLCDYSLRQWYFQEKPIPGATASSYVLTNAQPTNAGYYAVEYLTSANGTFQVVSI